jgi:hypothetical protein
MPHQTKQRPRTWSPGRATAEARSIAAGAVRGLVGRSRPAHLVHAVHRVVQQQGGRAPESWMAALRKPRYRRLTSTRPRSQVDSSCPSLPSKVRRLLSLVPVYWALSFRLAGLRVVLTRFLSGQIYCSVNAFGASRRRSSLPRISRAA